MWKVRTGRHRCRRRNITLQASTAFQIGRPESSAVMSSIYVYWSVNLSILFIISEEEAVHVEVVLVALRQNVKMPALIIDRG